MEDGPHKQEFHIRNLPTRSVTLFPTRAHIVRDIKHVTLKSGANEITVVGLTPTADEHSIKVEGTGSAVITDLAVELLPNRDIFEEIYPDADSDSDDPMELDDDELEATDYEDDVALVEVREKLVLLGDEQKRAKEVIANAESRLKILDSYGTSLERKCGVDIEASVETYRKEREKIFRDHMDGVVRERALSTESKMLQHEKARLLKLRARGDGRAGRAKAKAKRARERMREKQRRRLEERNNEKARIRREREHFWPRCCYTVRISLEAGTFTPGSSRRSSIASAGDVQLVSAKEPGKSDAAAGATATCDLTLSYVTSSAYWAPSYDLALSSTTNTAMLSFDARMFNMTSETWANSRVVLSTSQASFSGLQDSTPTLTPWRLRICGKGGGDWDGLDIAHSREESDQKVQWNAAQNAMAEQKPRAALFGVGPPFPQGESTALQQYALALNKAKAGNALQVQQAIAQQRQMQFAMNHPYSAPSSSEGALGAAQAAPYQRQAPQQFGRAGNADAVPGNGGREDEGGGDGDDARTMLEAAPEVGFQDSSFEETGLTATYDLPHLKTLRPSAAASKQRVARVAFAHVVFSRSVLAKYKPAAYLRARLHNTSKLTLLRGPAGLTLDGTFLGRVTLPRCSAGDAFTMPLGVDPAIRVAYPKPDVTRSSAGVFSRGEHSVYTRSVTLVNTRAAAGRPVAVTVLDQVPTSEDERLRVGVLQPAGMAAGGRAVPAGAPGRRDEADWGTASASLKKAGEVQWDVLLNAGKSVKLLLQYEVAFPTGEKVAQVK